ncbi:MAG: hypothetical protein WCS77_01155 [Elusimicrobiaceae bacterium]|jgi:hypothetical protein
MKIPPYLILTAFLSVPLHAAGKSCSECSGASSKAVFIPAGAKTAVVSATADKPRPSVLPKEPAEKVFGEKNASFYSETTGNDLYDNLDTIFQTRAVTIGKEDKSVAPVGRTVITTTPYTRDAGDLLKEPVGRETGLKNFNVRTYRITPQDIKNAVLFIYRVPESNR